MFDELKERCDKSDDKIVKFQSLMKDQTQYIEDSLAAGREREDKMMKQIRKMNKRIESFEALTTVPGLIGENFEFKTIAMFLKQTQDFMENSPNLINRLITVKVDKEMTENV